MYINRPAAPAPIVRTPRSLRSPSRRHRAFTLLELLVTAGVIATLLGILMPSLGSARRIAQATECKHNMRQIGLANTAYTNDHDGELVDVGLAHGGLHARESRTWLNTLMAYWESPPTGPGGARSLRPRSPLDTSPHWGPAPNGKPIPGSADPSQRRRTSYGLNDYLTSAAPFRARHRKLHLIHAPSSVVHTLLMGFGADPSLGVPGDYAGADHVHATGWFLPFGPPAHAIAATQSQTNAVRGSLGSSVAVSNWGFLDGHVEQAAFSTLGTSPIANKFNPDTQQ